MAGQDFHILGLNAYDHDVSACLLLNGEIVVAITKERLTRVKHDAGFYQEVLDYCLDVGGIDLDRVDLIVSNSYLLPIPEIERRLSNTYDPYHMTVREREQARMSPLFLSDDPRIVTCSHHLAHAYSAFAVCPFDEGAVMVVDGIGSYKADALEDIPGGDEAHAAARESESYYRFSGETLECIKKVWMGPTRGLVNDDFVALPGLGALYSRAASYIFGDWNKCGEVMGLAPYGRSEGPRLAEVRSGDLKVHEWPCDLQHPFTAQGDAKWEKSPFRKEWEDLAWRVQDDMERALIARANWLHEQTKTPNLAIAGGVGLNCVANGKIVAETPFRNVFIQPAAGDDGVAIGCAYYGHLALRKKKRHFVMSHAYWGRLYAEADVSDAASGFLVRTTTHRRKTSHAASDAAKLLAAGKTLGWFQGASEFGPRALGNRSILADPRDPAMKDRLNARVKHRQAFRPFAPAVIAERVDEFFEGGHASPFMLLALPVKPEMRAKIPAIVHTDGTARVQTVTRESNPFFHALLEAFGDLTGIPMLLNTSFNIRGEPIVETPKHALQCFLFTHLDVLVIHDWIFEKRAIHRAIFPLVKFGVNLGRNLKSDRLMERAAHRVLGDY
jgi:carbamoyltransferase